MNNQLSIICIGILLIHSIQGFYILNQLQIYMINLLIFMKNIFKYYGLGFMQEGFLITCLLFFPQNQTHILS